MLKLQEISDTAHQLHSKIDKTRIIVPSPQEWINDQDNMRRMWISTKRLIHKNNEWGNIYDQHFVNYMNHMYDNYPAGYGAKIRRVHDSEDRTIIFLQCLDNHATNLCSNI